MLYKYLSIDRVDVIENLTIRFSPLISLNDPFESRPLINVEKAIKNGAEELLSVLDKSWNGQSENLKTHDNHKRYKEQREAVFRGLKSELKPDKQGDDLVKLLGGKFGVLSLSRSNTNLLMWSHYTNSHAGYVLGFDDNHEFFRQRDMSGKIVRPQPVIYTEKRSIINIDHHNWRQKLLCEKPIGWAYEQEERLFMTFSNNKPSVGKDMCGMDIILETIPVKMIASIILGCNIKKDIKDRIITAKNKNKVDCPVYQAKMSKAEYVMEFEELKNA